MRKWRAPGSVDSDIAQLEVIFTDQRRVLAEELKTRLPLKSPNSGLSLLKCRSASTNRGLRLPDDVTLLWTDDNIGNSWWRLLTATE